MHFASDRAKANPPPSERPAELYHDHPLVGTIWSSHDHRPLSRAEAYDLLVQSDVVILGEIHDNPHHHRLQAEILQALVDRGQQPTVVFEMIPEDLQDELDAHLDKHPDDAEGLGLAVSWEERGWPDWRIYQPIAEVAIANRLEIRAGGLSEALQRRLAKEGTDAVDQRERERLGLETEMSSKAASLLDELLFRSHCGVIPREALASMRLIQRARDGAMADAIEKAAEDGPVVLIAGAGHARRDWGVPAQLAARDAGLEITSFALVEVRPELTQPSTYLPAGTGAAPVYDLLVFTLPAQRDDPCAILKDQLENSSATE
jgi:uncharacterized iron-regulated protein